MNQLKTVFLRDYTPAPFLIPEAELCFKLAPHCTEVTGKLHLISNSENHAPKTELYLNGAEFQLLKITIDGKELSPTDYQQKHDGLRIFNPPADFTLETTIAINPAKNFTCLGLYLSCGNFFTQNEPEGFRTFTYFIDRPDILTKFTTHIIASKKEYPELLSNGNLVEDVMLDDDLRKVTWIDPHPKSCYLFALVAGKFSSLEDRYVTAEGRNVTLRIYTDKTDANLCRHALYALKQAMKWDEEQFGLCYDLDLYQIVGTDDFNFGAMENKGLNIFNNRLLLASNDSATDEDYVRIASVIAHEYFHNWTGNRVSCRDWFQLCLKEGITTLREQLFTEDHYGGENARIDSLQFLYQYQYPEDNGKLAHPPQLPSYVEINNFYTTTVYEKGAEIARMLIHLFGRDIFTLILKEFLKIHDGKPTTIDDFIATVAKVVKIDLTQFKFWYTECGTPELQLQLSGSDLTLTQYHPKTDKDFYFPLTLNFFDRTSHQAIHQQKLVIKNSSFIYQLPETLLNQNAIFPVLADFTAPIKVNYPYTDEELLIIATSKASSYTARWEAAQKLFKIAIKKFYEEDKIDEILQDNLRKLINTLLDEVTSNPQWLAKTLTIPSLKELLEELTAVKISRLEKARRQLLELLNAETAPIFREIYLKLAAVIEPPFPERIGKRALKNQLLKILTYNHQKDTVYQLIFDQYTSANNFTDRYTALSLIARITDPQLLAKRQTILATAYEKWQNEPNLVNRWFAMQALVPNIELVPILRSLMQHPGFNLHNPNNVNSLLRNFAQNNLYAFHEAPDAAGYQLICENILACDAFNPLIAANLVKAFEVASRLDHASQIAIKHALAKLLSENCLSSQVQELLIKLSA